MNIRDRAPYRIPCYKYMQEITGIACYHRDAHSSGTYCIDCFKQAMEYGDPGVWDKYFGGFDNYLSEHQAGRACAGCDRPMYQRDYRYAPLYCCEPCRERQYKLNTHGRYKTLDPISCGHCATEFTPKRTDSKYCSGKCRTAAHRAAKKADQAASI